MSEQECNSTVNLYGDLSYTGRVKWFNRTAGWGFVTIVEGSNESTSSFIGNEIFVHWKNLETDKQQYCYLVNGEYITFTISFNQDSQHPYQAQSVRGIARGPLMCETRNERSSNLDLSEDNNRRPKKLMKVRPNGGGPRE